MDKVWEILEEKASSPNYRKRAREIGLEGKGTGAKKEFSIEFGKDDFNFTDQEGTKHTVGYNAKDLKLFADSLTRAEQQISQGVFETLLDRMKFSGKTYEERVAKFKAAKHGANFSVEKLVKQDTEENSPTAEEEGGEADAGDTAQNDD